MLHRVGSYRIVKVSKGFQIKVYGSALSESASQGPFIFILFYFILFYSFNYLLEKERDRAEEGQKEKERERIPNMLCAVSSEPDMGFELTNHKIIT